MRGASKLRVWGRFHKDHLKDTDGYRQSIVGLRWRYRLRNIMETFRMAFSIIVVVEHLESGPRLRNRVCDFEPGRVHRRNSIVGLRGQHWQNLPAAKGREIVAPSRRDAGETTGEKEGSFLIIGAFPRFRE